MGIYQVVWELLMWLLVFSNDLLIQWGIQPVTNYVTITFPIMYNELFSIVTAQLAPTSADNLNSYWDISIDSDNYFNGDLSNFAVWARKANTPTCTWLSIGT